MAGTSTTKIPIGLHKFYLSDHYTNALFWFMCGCIYVHGMTAKEAAIAYQEFLKLDVDNAPVNAITKKYYRQLPLFREAIQADRGLIHLNEEQLKKRISDGIHKRIGRENLRTNRRR